jgi:hypothetical protein
MDGRRTGKQEDGHQTDLQGTSRVQLA